MQRQSLFADPSFRAHLVWVTTGSTGALLLVLSAAVLIPLFMRFDAATSLDELRSLTQQILDLHTRFWPVVFTPLVSVFLTPPSMNIVEGRLRRRGTDSEAVIQKRLSVARQEIGQWKHFDYLLLSDTIQEDLRRMLAMIEAEKMRTLRVQAH